MVEQAPDIIALSEVNPKNARYLRQLQEYHIDGYDLESRNIEDMRRRGIIIYIRKNLKYHLMNQDTQFEETVTITIRTREDQNDLILVVVYRSPHSTEENNSALIDLINNLPCRNNTIVIMGDFNFPKIDWNTWTTTTSLDSKEFTFIETLGDNFLHQLTKEITRFRGADEPSITDLTITNDEDHVQISNHQSGLRRSDHVIINIEIGQAHQNQESDKVYMNYNKVNITLLRTLLNIDWATEFEGTDSVSGKWNIFHSKHETAVKRAVLKRKHRKFKTALAP